MDPEERHARLSAAREQEEKEPIRSWWLSFATEERFLGVAIVRARGVLHAIEVCRELGCGTGGEGGIKFEPVPEGEIDERWYNRLLTEDEVEALNAELDAKHAAS